MGKEAMVALSLFAGSAAIMSPIMSASDAPIKLGVNGFGRIARQVVRIATDRDSFVLKHINSPMAPEYMKYLLEHDTVHGRFPGTCEVTEEGLSINGRIRQHHSILHRCCQGCRQGLPCHERQS